MKKAFISIIIISLLLSNTFIMSKENHLYANSKLQNNTSLNNDSNNLGGLFQGNQQKANASYFDRINWKSDKYFKFKDTTTNKPNYQPNNFYVNWNSTTPRNGTNPNTNALVRANLPNTGSWIFSGADFGVNVLQTNLWNNRLTSDNNVLNLENGNWTLNRNQITNGFATNMANINSYLNLGLDFGSSFSLERSFTTSDTGSPVMQYNVLDNDSVFSRILNSENNNLNDVGINVPDAEKTSTTEYNDKNFYSSVKNKYYQNQQLLPYYGRQFNISNNDKSVDGTYYLGSFGIITASNQYFTITIEQNHQGKNRNSNYTQTSLIIDNNSSLVNQQNELNNLFRLSQDRNSSDVFTPYSEEQKINVLNAFNGKTDTNNSVLNNWGINSRQALSTISTSNFTAPPGSGTNNSIPITSDIENKNFPNRDVNSGFAIKAFNGSYLNQYWNNNNINDISNNTILDGFRDEFNLEDGYYRDTTNPNAQNIDYYAPVNFHVADCAYVYTTNFQYNANYNNSVWNISGYNDYLESAFSVKNTYGQQENNGYFYDPSEPVVNNYKENNNGGFAIAPVFLLNNQLSRGAMAAIIIMLFSVSVALVYYCKPQKIVKKLIKK